MALASFFGEVYATDPSEAQIAQAQKHERIHDAVENAEDCSLGDHTANLVTVAQAYHWFDAESYCAEARRVVRPGGVVAVWTYAESRVSPAVDAVFAHLNDGLVLGDWPPERAHVVNGYRDLPFPFAPIAAPAFELVCHRTLPQYAAYLRSWSAAQRYRQRTGQDAVDEVLPDMAAAWGDPAQARRCSRAVAAGSRPPEDPPSGGARRSGPSPPRPGRGSRGRARFRRWLRRRPQR